MIGTPVVPILAFYGLLFLLVLPPYRLGAKPLAMIAPRVDAVHDTPRNERGR